MSVAISNSIEGVVKETEKRLGDIAQQRMRAIQNDFDLTLAPFPGANGTSGGNRRGGEERMEQSTQEQKFMNQAKSFKERHVSLLESIASLN